MALRLSTLDLLMAPMVVTGHTRIHLSEATLLLLLVIPLCQLDITAPILSIAEQLSEAMTTSTTSLIR
jgi:hypothetical protein